MDLFETCVLVVNIMKMCMWVFGGARVDFDRIMTFELSQSRQFLVGYVDCVINSSNSFYGFSADILCLY